MKNRAYPCAACLWIRVIKKSGKDPFTVNPQHHLLISGLLKGAEDTIPIASLGTFCSADSVKKKSEVN